MKEGAITCGRWRGRILVIAWLRDDRKSVSLFADMFTPSAGWTQLFGRQPACRPAPATVVAPRLITRAKPKAKAAATAMATANERTTSRQQPLAQTRKRPWADVEKELFPRETSPGARKALRPRVAVARVGEVVLKAGRGESVTRHLNEKLLKSWNLERQGWKRGRDWGKGDEGHSAVTSEK